MPFVDTIDTNLPVIVDTSVVRVDREILEEPRAIESVERLVEDSDAVVIADNFGDSLTQSLAATPTELSQAEIETILESVTVNRERITSGDFESPQTVENAHRLYRMPIYGTLVIDVYV